jgi:hypothetical protein
LRASLEQALDESQPRKVSSIRIIVRSNLGETHTYTFPDLKQAIAFLQDFSEERVLDTTNAPELLTTWQARSKKRKPG